MFLLGLVSELEILYCLNIRCFLLSNGKKAAAGLADKTTDKKIQ